jgi:hypothetical protein
MRREQAQLAGRAPALALQTGGGQAGFLRSDFGDLGAPISSAIWSRNVARASRERAE